jgi:hypothetical protein
MQILSAGGFFDLVREPNAAQDAPPKARINRRGFISFAAIVTLCAVVISTTILAAFQYPALPYVEVQSKSPEYDGKFALLSHREGYWYLLAEEPTVDKDPDSDVLSAVPDEKVERVQYLGGLPYARCPENFLTSENLLTAFMKRVFLLSVGLASVPWTVQD